MGKYSNLKLPHYVNPDQKYTHKIQLVKDQIIEPNTLDREAILLGLAHVMERVGADLGDVNQKLLNFAGGKIFAAVFARGYRETRAIKEALQEQLKVIELTLEAYTQLTIDQFEVEGTTSLKMDDGSSVRVQEEPYAGVENKEVFRLWCIENDLGSQLQLWPSTTATLTKERLLAGLPEPDGVKAYLKSKIVFSKGKDEGGLGGPLTFAEAEFE